MMPEKVRTLEDPVLRKPCIQVVDVTSIYDLLNTMFETMQAEKGIGLAANQIGQSLQVFILRDGDTYKEYINPQVLSKEEEVDFEGEGCLSIPGISATTKRYRKLTLTWLDKFSNGHTADFVDMQAFAVQHEMDHLNGKLFIDQMGPMKKDVLIRKHKKFLRALGR
jgi:peptide deformylase